MALTLKELRSRYPQYDNVEDEPLARALHKKYYSGMEWDDFSSRIGHAPVEPAEFEDSLVAASQSAFRKRKTIQNEDGTTSSIRSMSVEDERLNEGRPTLIPSIWDGEELDAISATDRAVESGTSWPSYESNEQATAASKRISAGLTEPPEDKRREALEIVLEAGERGMKYALAREQAERTEGAQGIEGYDRTISGLGEIGRSMKKLVNSGDYTAEDLGIPQAAFDHMKAPANTRERELEQEKVGYAAMLFENPELAAQMYPELAKQPTEEEKNSAYDQAIAEGRGEGIGAWGGLLKTVWTDVFKSKWEGEKLRFNASVRVLAENKDIGSQILLNAMMEYPELDARGKDLLKRAATLKGMSVEEHMKDVSQSAMKAIEQEGGTYEDLQKTFKKIQKAVPASTEKSQLANAAAVLIQATPQAAYMIAAAYILRTPSAVIPMFAADIRGSEYGSRRVSGRSHEQAEMDTVVSMLIEGGTEMIPASKLFTALKKIRKGAPKAKALAEVGLVNLLQEEAAEGLIIAYDLGVIKEEMSWGEIGERLRDAGIAGIGVGVMVSAPAIAISDIEMGDATNRVNDAKRALQSVANRVMDPSKTGAEVPKDEIAKATKDYADAVQAKVKLIKERKEAEAEKAKVKGEKKEKKRVAKLTPKQKGREGEVKKQAEADQTVVGELTEDDLRVAESIEKAGNREYEEMDRKDIEELLDLGYAKISKNKELVILPGGKRRLRAVRAAQEAGGAALEEEGPIPVIPYTTEETKRRADAIDAEIGRLIRDEVVIEPKPYKSPENRQAELTAKVRESITAPAAQEKIVKAIVKAEEEEAAFAEIEAREAERIEQNMNAGYEQALTDQNEVEAEVALNLAKMDQRNRTAKPSRLGDVFRAAEKKLKQEADKARAAMDESFWGKPVQGQLFDVTGVLVKGSAEYAKAVKVGAFKLAQHGAKYSAWAADMVAEFGESIKPVLTKIYHDAKQNVANVLKWSHERHAKGKKKGELKFGPKKYAKPGALKQLRAVLSKLAKEGADSKKWYERSGKAILKATGNVREARKFAGLLAIYSTGTGVGPNLTNALKMWSIFKAGKKVLGEKTQAGRFTRQDREAREWLTEEATDDEFYGASGPKVFAFYTNLMREIDPKTYEFGQGVTVDIWMMRAFGYDTPAPTDAQYAFAAVELRQLAEKLGWERQQVQAAVWVAIKSRWAYIQKRSETRAVKAGLADWFTEKGAGLKTIDVTGETRADQIENEKKIAMIYREEALKATVGEFEASLERSKKDFSDFLEKQYATISWEADPSTSLGLVFNSMPIEDKVLLQYEIAQILTNPETGREFLAEWLGLIGADQFQGPGVWDGAVTAATQNKVLAPQQHKTSHLSEMLQVQPESKSALDGYAAIVGFLLKQDAVAWHRPFYGKALKRANGVGIVMPENMDSAELSRRVTKLYSWIVSTAQEAGYSEQTGLDWAPIVLDGEIRVLNFTEIPNREFHKLIREAVSRSNVGGAIEVFQTDGNMVTNDWVENPNGEQYEQEINRSENKRVQKAFERAKDQFTKRIAAVYEKYAEKYKAQREPTVTVTRLDGSLQERVQKLPALKKGMIRFRHFGKKAVGVIKTELFGTGIKGAERKRGSERVISAYPDKGFVKEVGLGEFEYVIDIAKEDLYDANNDPLGFREKATVPTGVTGDGKPVGARLDWQAYERLIKGAGFAGYYTPDASGNLKGQARFFYDLTVGPGAVTAQSFVPARPVIQIKENEVDHFEVIDTDGKLWEIEDPDDAINKAREIYGEDSVVEIVDEHGDVIVTEQPEVKAEKLTYTTLEMSTGIPIETLKKANALADIQYALDEFMAEYEEETTSVNDRERVYGAGAAIDLNSLGGSIWIDSIRAFEAGEGQGNEALKFIIELADSHGVQLKLFAQPFDAENLEQAELIEWYQRNGFAVEKPVYKYLMVREPRNVTGEFMRIRRSTTPTNAFMGPERDHVESVVFRFQEELDLDEAAFEIVDSIEELPEELYSEVVMAAGGVSVQGAFHDDPIAGPTIYLITNNIRAERGRGKGVPFESRMDNAIQKLIIHELIGHFGLQAMLGPKKYNQYMDQIRRAFPEEVAKRGKRMGHRFQSRRLAAEEVFAYMVQDELLGVDLTKTKTSFIDKIIAEIRLILMRMGWVEMSRDDMLQMMFRSAEFVTKHDVAFLKKRASKVKAMKDANYAIERAEQKRADQMAREVAGATFSLVQDRETDPDLDAFMDKIGNKKGELLVGLREMWDRFTSNLKNRAEIENLDQFAGFLHAEELLGMEFGPTSGYMSVRIAAGIDVMVRSAMENSVPTWDAEGAVAMDPTSKGLLEILAPIAQNEEMLELFEGFLVARRAKRLKGEDRERLFSSKEIAAMEREIKKFGYKDIFEATAAELAEYKSKVLDFAEEAGLINSQERPLWEHHDHIPFYRVLTEDKTGPYANARMGNVGQQIHRLEGGKEVLRNPLANIVENISVLIEASVKNRATADVIKNFMGTGVVTKAPRAKVKPELVPMEQVRDMLNEHGVALDAVGNELLSGVQKLMTLQVVTGDNVVSVQEQGKRQYYYVHDTGVMRGFDNIKPENWGWLMKALRYPKRIFTLVITRMPPFILKNWFRDMIHSFVLSRHGTIAPVYDSIRGWGKAIVEDKTYKDILSGGGMFDSGYVNASDPRTTQRAIRKQLIEKGGGNVLDTPRKLARFYMRLANGAENAHRIVIYQKALKRTGSRKQALFESRDIMDFAVRGANPVIRFLCETVPFWGARVQGISRTFKGRHHPVTMAMRALPIVLATLALYAWNRDDDRYKSLNDYEKRMYYHFYDVFEKGDHYRLPKPFEVGAIFSTIPEMGLEVMLSEEPDKGRELANAIYWTFREQFGLSPSVQAVAPIFELMLNENLFTEAPILTEYEKMLDPKEQHGIRTSKVITRLAQSMPEAAPDFMKSPKQLEHLLKGYFASAYEYSVGAADMMYNTLSDDPNKAPTVRWDEALFVNAFVREPYGKYDKYQEVMYDVLEAANKIHNSINLLEKLGTDAGDERIEFLEERYEALLYARDEMTPARKAIAKINKEIRQVYADESMSPTEKREEVDLLLEDRRIEAKEVWDYRPGGKENPYKRGLEKMLEDLIGKNKREQVDALISAELPHTATLINDITIGYDKLKVAA